MRVRIWVYAVVGSENRCARRKGDPLDGVTLRGLEDVERAEHVDARAEQRVLARGRDQDRGEMHDGIAACDRILDCGGISDVSAPNVDLAGRALADDRIEERPIVLLIEQAHAMPIGQEFAGRPRADEAESAGDQDAHQATAAAAAKDSRSSPASVSASVGSPIV